LEANGIKKYGYLKVMMILLRKTRVYFTGGCQHSCGLFQYTDFDGPTQLLLEAIFNNQ
jgi:hypothetical protein